MLQQAMQTSVVRRLGTLVAMSSIVALALMSPQPTEVRAATAECGTGGNYFAGRGFEPPGYEPRGATAKIEVRAAPLRTSGPDTDSTAWSMLAADDGGGWAQIGYVHKNYGTTPLRFFFEWLPLRFFFEWLRRPGGAWSSPEGPVNMAT